MSAVRKYEIERDGSELIRNIAQREPAKVIALKAAITPRHAYNLREEVGQPQLKWSSFLMMARQYPELTDFVARVLELPNPASPQAEELLRKIERLVEGRAEEGDRIA